MPDGMEIRRLPAFLREQLVEFAGAEGAERAGSPRDYRPSSTPSVVE